MVRVEEAPGVSAGYKEPDVDWHELDEGTVRRIVNDEEEVAGLRMTSSHKLFNDDRRDAHWAAVVGSAFGDSIRLRKLEVQEFRSWDERNADLVPDGWLHDHWNLEFLPGLARNRSIEHLNIVECDFPPNSFEVISPCFFVHNHNLRSIEIHGCDLSENFPFFLLALSTNHLEQFYLDDSNLRGVQVTKIIKALASHCNLREIHLSENEIFRSGFVALSKLLQQPHSKIHCLDISDKIVGRPCFDDESITILTGALIVNMTLRELSVGRNVTATSWRVFSGVLYSPICSLESLNLKWSALDDEGIMAIGDALIGNKTLKHLILPFNGLITIDGWRFFTGVMQRGSKLKTLELGVGANFNKEVFIDFATALASNSSLCKLRIRGGEYTDRIVWDAFSHVLDVSCVECMHAIEFLDRWDRCGMRQKGWWFPKNLHVCCK